MVQTSEIADGASTQPSPTVAVAASGAARNAPVRVTRSATKADREGTDKPSKSGDRKRRRPVLLTAGLEDPEPRKARKRTRTVVIEHSAGAPALFRTKAAEVREGVENAVAGVQVIVDPEDEREGCFVVRDEFGHEFLYLENMTRPFAELRDLDVEDLVRVVVEGILQS